MGRFLLPLLLASLGTLLNARWADARPANVDLSDVDAAEGTESFFAPDSTLGLQEVAIGEPHHYQQLIFQHPVASKLAALTRHVIAKRSTQPDRESLTKQVDDFITELLETSGNKTLRVCGKSIHNMMKKVCLVVSQLVGVLKNADEVKFILRKLKGEHTSVLNACCYSAHGCGILQALPFAEEKCFYPPKQRRSASVAAASA